MRHIEKRETPPSSLTNWVKDPKNKLQENLSNPDMTGTMLWDRFSEKADLKQALLEDQGAICCYCGKRIKNDLNTRIEHIQPKDTYKHLTFEFTNLLVSCQGGTKNTIHIVQAGESLSDIAVQYGVDVAHLEEVYLHVDELDLFRRTYDLENLQAGDRLVIFPLLASNEQHCDNKKGRHEIDITPLQLDCTQHFSYEALTGQIKETSKNKKTVQILGLNNNAHLSLLRKKTLEVASLLKQKLIKDYGTSKDTFNQQRLELIRKLNQIQDPNDPTVKKPLKPFVFVTIWSLSN